MHASMYACKHVRMQACTHANILEPLLNANILEPPVRPFANWAEFFENGVQARLHVRRGTVARSIEPCHVCCDRLFQLSGAEFRRTNCMLRVLQSLIEAPSKVHAPELGARGSCYPRAPKRHAQSSRFSSKCNFFLKCRTARKDPIRPKRW